MVDEPSSNKKEAYYSLRLFGLYLPGIFITVTLAIFLGNMIETLAHIYRILQTESIRPTKPKMALVLYYSYKLTINEIPLTFTLKKIF